MDFLGDLVSIIAIALDARGIAHDSPAEIGKIAFVAKYIEFEGRRIEQRPRKVEFSRALDRQIANDQKAREQILLLKGLAEAGGDLQPFQTKNIRSFDSQDLLLSDWGIQHLHLGELNSEGDFATRTGDLLFVTVLPDIAYFISRRSHQDFHAIELVEDLEESWPEYMDRFTFKDAVDLSNVPTSEDVKHLRRAGVMSLVKLKSGRILAPPGGGFTTAGTSIGAMLKAQALVRRLRHAERHVKEQEPVIRRQLAADATEPLRLTGIEGETILIGSSGAISLPLTSADTKGDVSGEGSPQPANMRDEELGRAPNSGDSTMLPRDPWKIAVVDRLCAVMDALIGLATAALVLPALFLRDFLAIPNDQPLASHLTRSAYVATFSFGLTIFLGLVYRYAAAKWIKDAWGQKVRMSTAGLESILDWSFWMAVIAFGVGLTSFLVFAAA